jgi:hypothetical protein
MPVELVIRHDGVHWVAGNEHLVVSAPTLEELDAETGKMMRQMGLVKKGEKAEVFMAFDNSTIPQWIRPYSQHYFNRIIEVQG